MQVTDNIEVYNESCFDRLAITSDESIDIVCIDPPYLYLKHKLDIPFNEPLFFHEVKRTLTKNGFIIMFGRGASFYRWGAMLYELGFTFKEEIIWDKSQCSSPLMNLSRVHETISIWSKGKGIINKCKIPYLEIKGHDINSICDDIKRMRSILKNTQSLNAVLEFLENNTRDESDFWSANNLSISSAITKENRSVSVARSIKEGLNEKSIIRTDLINKTQKHKVAESDEVKDFDRCVNVTQSICYGLNEKSIIKQVRDHYTSIHPTQKPVRLLERLLQLVVSKDNSNVIVADWFGGSYSTMKAVHNMGLRGISTELQEVFHKPAIEQLKEHCSQLNLFTS